MESRQVTTLSFNLFVFDSLKKHEMADGEGSCLVLTAAETVVQNDTAEEEKMGNDTKPANGEADGSSNGQSGSRKKVEEL